MQKFFKSIGVSLAGIGVVLAFNYVEAAAPTARPGMVSSQQRMPTMPTMTLNMVGNMSPTLPTNPGGSGSGGGGNNGCTPGSNCQCPDGSVGICRTNGTCACPNPPQPGECTDGGERNSEYTVESCMNDVLGCINAGALPGGLNDLFNYDLRNAIVNGMGLCSAQVEKCIEEVRKDCRNLYRVSSDVWLDFNSRRVQPEYYSFILRKTGLTPNQAENTCWLLDKNTFGASFNAVANNGTTTSEYNNQVGAYNSQAGGLGKSNPMGPTVNNGNSGVDGQRGHYARWDATTGECLVRVAAYNKDSHIKNSWLFGALGDDKPAEVWKSAGSSFSCNKDLFGFSLMNQTGTMAIVGVGGGTLVGAGIGAIAGHGARDFDCGRPDHREQLTKELRATGRTGLLNEYLDMVQISATGPALDDVQCEAIVELFDLYQQAKMVDKACVPGERMPLTVYAANFPGVAENGAVSDWTTVTTTRLDGKVTTEKIVEPTAENKAIINRAIAGILADPTKANDISVNTPIVAETAEVAGTCPTFHPLNKAKLYGTGMYCTATTGCISGQDLAKEVTRLGGVMNNLKILEGESGNRLKTTLVGAGIGAATGGVATAITAFVEKNNITCRVGDGLEKVSFGKSYSIGSLKDFYVKWNLRLPDTIMPTATATDCTTWKNACATLTDLNQCAAAQINFKPANSGATILIPTACVVSGSACLENHTVAVSFGACQ